MGKYYSDYFSTHYDLKEKGVLLTMQVLNSIVNTTKLPATHHVLDSVIPSIFNNECFNQKKLTFFEEAKNTEVAHLLEHLILENLKLIKLKNSKTADFRGLTSWNWEKNPYGTFKINISSRCNFHKYFFRAFKNSVLILNYIYEKSLAESGNLSKPDQGARQILAPELFSTL